MKTPLRLLRQSYGLWPVADQLAHRYKIRGPIGRYLCYRADRAFGLTKAEARS
jgi:hypothetical protein